MIKITVPKNKAKDIIRSLHIGIMIPQEEETVFLTSSITIKQVLSVVPTAKIEVL